MKRKGEATQGGNTGGIERIRDDKDELNTKKTMKWAVKTLRDFLADKNMDINFKSYTAAILNDVFATVLCVCPRIQCCQFEESESRLNRHLSDVNIISDTVFKTSNAFFKAILKRYIKSGKDTSFHQPRITESDLQIIRCSSALSPDTPVSLVRKVWFDIQLCFARCGREGSRELTMTSFIIQRDEHGVEYISLAHNPQTKKHKDPNEPHKEKPTRVHVRQAWGSSVSSKKFYKVHLQVSTRCKNRCISTQSAPSLWHLMCGTPGSQWVSTTWGTC